jgi:flagellar basal body rod protein FlgG
MKDIYTSLSGSMCGWHQVELISNNIANVNTTGYREQRAAYKSDGQSASYADATYNAADGALEIDNDPHHFALRGDGFFTLANNSYTRDGHFHVDLDGNLLTQDGIGVLDDLGAPIVVRPGELLSVTPQGNLSGSVSGPLGKFGLVQLGNPQPAGGNIWQGNPTPITSVSVVQGAVEHSNADPLRSMVELIEASRYFEAQEKVIRTSDEMHARLNRINT